VISDHLLRQRTGSLGCARLGVASIVGVALGILIGRAVTLIARKTA
jgi:hypothetical protein